MKLQVNGEEHDLPATLTLAALIERLGMRADRVAVERNREIVAREHWPATELRDGDRLEIVHFVGGGSTADSGKSMRRFLILIAAATSLVLPARSSPQTSSAPTAPAQASSAPPCREDRSVDEYLAEINKAKKQRNKNPLPNSICIAGLCKGSGEKPDPRQLPTSHPPQSPAPGQTGENSSSKESSEAAPAYDPFAAAQSVEVGDYYYSEKKYRAALSRYQEALESKPDDAAIYLRLGRTFDKLGEPTRAFESYDASLTADPGGPAAEEARKAVERLQPGLEERGENPHEISQRNRSRIVPRCRAVPPVPSSPSSPPR